MDSNLAALMLHTAPTRGGSNSTRVRTTDERIQAIKRHAQRRCECAGGEVDVSAVPLPWSWKLCRPVTLRPRLWAGLPFRSTVRLRGFGSRIYDFSHTEACLALKSGSGPRRYRVAT